MLNKSLVNSTSFGLVDKNGNKINSSSNRTISDLRPDESLYKDRIKMLEKESELRRKKYSESTVNVRELSKEEKEKKNC